MREDLRYALRLLLRSPGFTTVVVITLALGIGANSAIFSLVDGVLLRPLPFSQPQQLARIYSEFPTFPNGGLHRFWLSGPEYLELRGSARSWSAIEAWSSDGANLSGGSRPMRIQAASVTGGLLAMLGVPPARGRLIASDDDQPGAPRVAVISWNLWQHAFGASSSIVGLRTELNGANYTVIGVMPAGFEFPLGATQPVELWTPMQLNPARPGGRSSHYLNLVGRLKPRTSLAQARAEFAALEAAWGPPARSAHVHDFSPDRHPITTYALQDEVTAGVRPALLLLLGAVGLVLLIACVNVASLLLARTEARQREIAIRAALGAGRQRLLRQFLIEGLVLSWVGAMAGLGLAALALRSLTRLSDASIPRLAQAGLDPRVLGFTLALALATGIVFGLTPLVHAGGGKLFGRLKAAGGGSLGGRAKQRFRQALVAGEIALALALLMGAGLMIRGFWNLQRVDVGFDPANLMSMQIALPPATSARDAGRFMQRLQAALERLPAISAALASGLVPNRPPDDNDTGIAGFVQRPGGPIRNVEYYQAVSPEYFATLRIHLIAGRCFDQRDGATAPLAVIVNQRMAQTFWPGENPLGHQVQPGQQGPWATVVGVVADVKNKGVGQDAGTELYLPLAQASNFGVTSAYILTRSPTLGSGAQVAAVRRAVQALDPALPLAQVASMEAVLSRAQARPRMLAWLLLVFAAVALALAAVGIYGVMSYAVTQRRREFGLRTAIGAAPGHLLRLVLGQACALAAIGIAAGIGLTLAASGAVRGLVFGIAPTDPATLVAVAALLAAVALAACWLPARRAMRADPMIALREE